MGGKSLIVIRHGKASPREASWTSGALEPEADFRRKLVKKGVGQANHLAQILSSAGQRIDKILTSSADRALETAMIIARHLKLEGAVEADESFYGCGPEHWMEELRERSRDAGTVMVVGHNPELEALASMAGDGKDLTLPTGGTVKLAELESWSDLGYKRMSLRAFVKPSETMDRDLEKAELAGLWG